MILKVPGALTDNVYVVACSFFDISTPLPPRFTHITNLKKNAIVVHNSKGSLKLTSAYSRYKSTQFVNVRTTFWALINYFCFSICLLMCI